MLPVNANGFKPFSLKIHHSTVISGMADSSVSRQVIRYEALLDNKCATIAFSSIRRQLPLVSDTRDHRRQSHATTHRLTKSRIHSTCRLHNY